MKKLNEAYGIDIDELQMALKKELGIDSKAAVDGAGDDYITFEVDGIEYYIFTNYPYYHACRLAKGFDDPRTAYGTEAVIEAVKEELGLVSDENYDALINALDKELDDEIEGEIEYQMEQDSFADDDAILGYAMEAVFSRLPIKTQRELVPNLDNISYSDMINLLKREDLKRYIDKVRTIKRRLGIPLIESHSEKKCVLCGKEIEGYGNNPAPLADEGKCCDSCNSKRVIPARLKAMKVNKMNEDVKKLPNGKYANVGKDGKANSGKFKTKKAADAQRKAMFANGYKESIIRYPNGMEATDVDLDRALDYQYGTDRDKDNSKYTDDEKQRAVNYWIKKTDSSPYNESKVDSGKFATKKEADAQRKAMYANGYKGESLEECDVKPTHRRTPFSRDREGFKFDDDPIIEESTKCEGKYDMTYDDDYHRCEKEISFKPRTTLNNWR